jgi:hypothetical protein
VFKNGIDYLATKNKGFETQFIEEVLTPMFPDCSVVANPNKYAHFDVSIINPINQSVCRIELEVDHNSSLNTRSIKDLLKDNIYQALNIPARKSPKNWDLYLRFGAARKAFWCASSAYVMQVNPAIQRAK